jgi:hypothetical protein
MKVRIFNNRLALECRIPNLDEASDEDLRKAAAKYQIGWQKLVTKDVEVINRGRTVIKSQETLQPKGRRQVAEEIRKHLTIKFFIPRELWTPEQEEAFNTNDLMNEKDIQREEDVKRSSGIMVVLPPKEETKDNLKLASMYADVTEDQWEWLKTVFNKKFKRIKDDEGRTIEKKESYVHRLMAEEYIPENDREEARLKEEEEKKAKKTSIKKESKEK